jgi:hypothetical protein
LKRKNLELVLQGLAEITPDKSHFRNSMSVGHYLFQSPRKDLLTSGSFYLEFAPVDRAKSDAFAFLTKRGGSNISKSTAELDLAEKSRPILLNQDGTTIKKSALVAAGFQVVCLHKERTPINIAAVEE